MVYITTSAVIVRGVSIRPSSTFLHSDSSSLSLFSRQRYVLGDSAMHQMAQSSVFLSGMGGMGVEIGRQYLMV